jgi:hypothetical protein
VTPTRTPRKPDPSRARDRSLGLWNAWPWILPGLVAVVLCAPLLGLGYFWDDYYFLTQKGGGNPTLFALPSPDWPLYRPLSQYLYFRFLQFDPSGLLGHVTNLAILLLSVGFLVSLVSRLRGPTAGVLAGLAFATFGHVPALVGWVSCDQDLFAILFFLAALLLRDARKDLAAIACAVCAVFSKETALGWFPILIFWDHLVGRRPTRAGLHLAILGGFALAWSWIHPGIRTIFLHHFEPVAAGYVGRTRLASGMDHLFRYLLTLLNLPTTGISTRWPADRTWAGIVALALILPGIRHISRSRNPERPKDLISTRRVVWIALLMIVPAILLPAFLVRHWATYFASIASVGVAMLIGTVLAEARLPYRVAFFLVFVPLGIWCRGLDYGEQAAWSERTFLAASHSARELEGNFKRLYPALPHRAQILFSATGIRQIFREGHAPQIWYRDPTITTSAPERYARGTSADFLVRATPELAIVGIDADSMRVRWSGVGTPNPVEINSPIRGYARGLAAAGFWERAVHMLERLSNVEQGMERAYDLRLIAMIRLAQGARGEAERIMNAADPFPRGTALEIVKKLYAESSLSSALDSCSFEAFGLSASDPAAVRYLMRWFWAKGWIPEAVHFARWLDALRPGDPESIEVLDRSKGLPARPM